MMTNIQRIKPFPRASEIFAMEPTFDNSKDIHLFKSGYGLQSSGQSLCGSFSVFLPANS